MSFQELQSCNIYLMIFIQPIERHVNRAYMSSGKMLNLAGPLKLAGGVLEGTSVPPSDPQTCI